MTNRLQKACNVLKWAIDHKKSITESCAIFKVTEKTIRMAKQDCIDHDGYKEFITLYNKFKNGEEANEEELLDKNKEIESPYLKFTEEQKNKGVLDARGKSHVRSLEDIVREAKIDLNLWEVERHVVNKWDVTNAEGQTYQNWQVKVWLKKREAIEQAINAEEFYKNLLAQHKPFTYPKIKYVKKKESNLLEINIFDLHFGKMAWSGETGEDYDIKIAAKRFIAALQGLVARASGSDFDRILLPIGNDFFNSDTTINTTFNGTIQDEDTRWQKTFTLGVKLLTEGIDYLRQFAPVDVLVIPGNHDTTRVFFAGATLEAWYRNDESVNINNQASPRKYYRYGKVLLGLTHGNEEKESRLPQVMALERKSDWAETDHHEWHLGHFHKKRAVNYKVPVYDEDLGVMIRYMSSLSATDSWHHKKSYVGTKKAAEAYLWNSETGFIGQFNVNVG